MTDKKFNVLVSDRSIHPSGIDLLRPVAELTFLEGYAAPEVFAAAVSETDAIFCRSGIVDASVIDAAPKLATDDTGVNHSSAGFRFVTCVCL